jgi:polar amino acid transport system substrate-binding protein
MRPAGVRAAAGLALAAWLGAESVVASPVRQAAAAEPATLDLCFEETPALPWRSRQKQGLYFELLDEVARRLGLHFEYHPQPWPFCLAEVAAGRMDGAFAVAFSPERRPVFAFPPGAPDAEADALREDAIVLVRRRGTAVDVVDGQLVGSTRPVGVQPGYAIADDLKRAGWAVEMSSRDHLVQLSRLSSGELDAIALGAFRWAQLQAAGGVALDDLEALPQPLLTKRYFLGLSHAFVAAHPALAQRLWATTREARTSVTFRRREQAAMAEALTPRSSP